MRKLKFRNTLSLVLATSVLLNTPSIAFAEDDAPTPTPTKQEIGISATGVSTSEIPIGFTVEERGAIDPPPMFVGDIVVELPASVEMVRNESLMKWVGSDKIGIRGNVNDIATVVASLEKTCDFINEEANATVTANIVYGKALTSDPNVLAAVWSGSDLRKGADDVANTVYKDFNISAQTIWDAAGEYDANLEFTISVERVDKNIGWECVPIVTKSNLMGMSQSKLEKKVMDGYTQRTYATLILSFTGNETSDIFEFSGLVDNNEYSKVAFDQGSMQGISPVRVLKLVENQYIRYSVGSTLKLDEFKTWLFGLSELGTVILPSNITYNTLQRRSVRQTEEYTDSVKYDPKSTWSGTQILVGDALFFITGRNDDGTWRYVPDIIYGGTMEQWKALSYYKNVDGKEWLFANAGNTTYVHCVDGTLRYN